MLGRVVGAAVLIAGLGASAAQADDFLMVGETQVHGVSVFVDQAATQKTGEVAQFRLLSVKGIPGQHPKYIIATAELDCGGRRIRYTKAATYAQDGTLVQEAAEEAAVFEDLRPEPVFQTIFLNVCEGYVAPNSSRVATIADAIILSERAWKQHR